MCNCMRNPYGVTMVCGCACGMLSCFRMCDTFQICQCNVDQGIKEDHIQTRLGMGWEASMGVRSTGGYFSWILSSHPWLQGKPSQSMGSPGSPASLLKNCSGEASPFPPALAVVVSPGLKDVVDKMEGSSGPTKFLGLFDSSFWIQKCKKQSPSKGKGSPRNMRTSPKTYRMCWDAAVS